MITKCIIFIRHHSVTCFKMTQYFWLGFEDSEDGDLLTTICKHPLRSRSSDTATAVNRIITKMLIISSPDYSSSSLFPSKNVDSCRWLQFCIILCSPHKKIWLCGCNLIFLYINASFELLDFSVTKMHFLVFFKV